jgi:amidase
LLPLADFTDVLKKHPQSTRFLEGYWRRRDDAPAARHDRLFPRAAFPHDQSQPIEKRVVQTLEGPRSSIRDVASWIGFASVAGLPATVAPIGRTAAGPPVGVQVVAPMWEDSTAIEFAALLADVVDGFSPPPAFNDR